MGTLKSWWRGRNKFILVSFLVCWALTIGWGALYVLHFSGSVIRAAVVAVFTIIIGGGGLYGMAKDWGRKKDEARERERKRERRETDERTTRGLALNRALLGGSNPPEIKHHGGHTTLSGWRFTAIYPDGQAREGFVTDDGQIFTVAKEGEE